MAFPPCRLNALLALSRSDIYRRLFFDSPEELAQPILTDPEARKVMNQRGDCSPRRRSCQHQSEREAFLADQKGSEG